MSPPPVRRRVIVVLSDTHGRTDHRLTDHLKRAVREADLVIHAGDFVTRDVYDAFDAEATAFEAVYGNNDPESLRERLPARRAIDLEEFGFGMRERIALCHGHEHDGTSLSLFGREQGARLVISGHSHDPGVTETSECTLLDPGSHADPRWNRPAYAELDATDEGGLVGTLREPDGGTFEDFTLRPTEH